MRLIPNLTLGPWSRVKKNRTSLLPDFVQRANRGSSEIATVGVETAQQAISTLHWSAPTGAAKLDDVVNRRRAVDHTHMSEVGVIDMIDSDMASGFAMEGRPGALATRAGVLDDSINIEYLSNRRPIFATDADYGPARIGTHYGTPHKERVPDALSECWHCH